jgi:hypothetical protein
MKVSATSASLPISGKSCNASWQNKSRLTYLDSPICKTCTDSALGIKSAHFLPTYNTSSHSDIVAILLNIVGVCDRVSRDKLIKTMERFDVPFHIIEFSPENLEHLSLKVRVLRMRQFIPSEARPLPHTRLWTTYVAFCTINPIHTPSSTRKTRVKTPRTSWISSLPTVT